MKHIYKKSIILAIGLLLMAFGANKVSGQVEVTLTPDPVQATYCEGSSIEFGTTVTPTGTYTYTWTIGSGSPTIGTATYIYTVPAASFVSEIITVEIDDGTDTDTDNFTVNIDPLPTATATGSASICQNSSYTLTTGQATALNGTIAWTENGAGSITSGETTLTPTYTPAAGDAGNTVVLLMTVTSDNSCGSAIATATFNINVTATHSISLNSGNNIQTLCNNASISAISYTIGGGATNVIPSGLPPGLNTNLSGNTYTISGAPTQAGVFPYTLSTTGGSCSPATVTGTITVKALPAVSLSPATETICEETPVSITMTIESGANWAWFDSYPGPEKTRIFPSLPIGINDIYVTAYKDGCSNIAHSIIEVVGNVTATVLISSNDPDNIVCDGTEVTFTASPVNGGASPVYEWFVNDVSQTGETSELFAFTPANGDEIRVEMESSLCNNGIAISNTISMTVNAIVTPSVSISPSATNVCAGTEVTYTAIPQNGGTSPSYQWKVNGGNVGSNNNTYAYNPANGDQITVVMTSDRDCITTPTATSVPVTMIVNPILTASVTISASDLDLEVCENTPVTFTANPTNGGNSPSYQWKVNNINVGSNSSTYSYIPLDNDIISVVMTSNAICVTGSPATSSVTMTVNNQLIVGVGLQVSENNICEGESVTFTATAYNGGSSPIYQWKVNGVNSGASTTSNTFVFTPSNGQQISVTMTSNETCIVNTTATSDPITMVVNPNVVPTAEIFATKTEICEGESVAFSAIITNGGSTPFYQWKVNGINAGTNNPIFTYTPEDEDIVTVFMTSSLNCVTIETVEALPITMTVNPLLPVSVVVNASDNNVCAGTAVTFQALGTNAGQNPTYQWKINNSNIGTNTNTYTYAPANTDQVHVVMTSSEQCVTGNPATAAAIVMNVLPAPSVNLTFIQGSTSACVGDSIKMTTVYSPAYVYTWFNGITQVKTGQGPGANLYAFKLNQTSSIRVEVTLGGCTIEAIKTIDANPLPEILLTADNSEICVGEPLTLILTGISGTTWNWINPDYVLNYTPIIIYPEVGEHVFSAQATSFFNCVNTAYVAVTVRPKPVVAITTAGGLNACVEQPKTYLATQNANYSYSWFVNEVEIPGTNTYTFTDILAGETPTEIKVKVTNNLTGCSNADSLVVNPVFPPILNMVASRLELCEGDQTFITLSTTNPPVNPPVYFAWGDGLQGNVLTRGFIPTKDTSIWAEAINATGCITRKTFNILVRDTLAFTIAASSGNDPVCAGANVTFTGPTGASYKYQWYVGGVAEAGAVNQTFIRSFTQNATVRLIVTDTVIGCSGSAFKNIITKNAPVFNLGPDQEVCQNYVITLEGPVGAGFTYAWFRNAEATPISTQRVLNFLVPAGVTTLRLEASSVEGCTTTDAVQITSKAVPGINLVTNKPEICINDIVTLTATTTGAASVLWFDGLTTLGPHIRILSPNVGDSTFIFWAQAVNSIGCVSRDSVSVTVNNPPVVNIQAVGGSTQICVNTPVTIQGPQQPGYIYQWYIDGEETGTNSHLLTFTVTEDVAVTLEVTDGNTCATISAPLSIQVIDLPGIEILQNKTDICLGETVQLTINQQNISGYVWADGLGGNQPVRSFIPETVGVFKFWANGLHNITGCLSSDTIYVNVHPIPVALINPPAQTTVCQGQNIVLTTVMLPNHQYKWSINGDSVAAGASYTFAALQTRTVVLTVKNQFGCVKTDEIVITVEDAPEVDLGGNRQICTNYLLELTGPNIAGYTYKWFVNNVQIANNTHQYAFIVTQPVTVRLEATVGNCTSTDQITVTPLVVPGINLTANNSEICLGEAVTLQVSTTFATSFIWWDGLGGNLTTRSVVPLQADTTIAFWAEAINGIGCRSRDTVFVKVNPLPAVPLTVVGGSNIICFNATATVQGPQLAGHSYQWFIDDVPVGTNSFQHSFVVTKDVVVKLEVTDANGCVNANQTAIQMLNLPGIILSPDSLEVCLGGSFTLAINDQFVNSYSWFDGLAGNLKQRTFEANSTGNFIYWVEGVNAFGCVSRDTAYITVHPNPDVEIVLPGGNDTFCEGETILLSASQTAGLTFEWIVGGVVKATTAVYTFVGVASVEVTLVATDANGCFDTDIVTINVEDAPEVDLGGDRQICTNYLLELSGPANPNYTYQWFVNNQLIGNVTNTYAFVVTQITTVRLVVTAGDCVASDEITVTPLAIPTINVTASDEAICLGESVTLTLSTQNATSFIWWDGLGGNLTQRAVTPLAGDTTIAYWAQAINGIGCTSRDTVFVTVNPLPEVPLAIVGGSNIICFNSTATVQGPQLAGHSYQWFIDEVAVGVNSFQHSFVVTEDVMVKLEITDANGCINSNQIAVNVRNLPGILLSPDSLEVCLGGSFTLTLNDQNVNSYSWFDGLAGNLKQRTFTANAAGSFIYWVEGVNSFGCISRDTAFITVHPNPDVYIVEPFGGNRYCQNEAILLEASIPTGLVYNWFVDGVLSGTDSVFSFLTEVSVEITLLVTDENGCQDSDTISINVFDAPEVDLGGDRQVCIGYPLTFTAPVDGEFYYEWYVNNVLVSTDSVYSFIVTQNLTLRLYVGTDVGCSDSDEIIITTLASPVINLTPAETAICLGETVQISLTTNGSSFIWWDGLGTNLNTRSFTPTFGDSTYVYWAEAINAIGCKSRDTAFVTVNSHPVIEVSIPGNNTFCYGTQATVLGPVVAGYQYQWYVNNLPAGNGNGSALNFTVYGNSMVRLDVTDANGCIGSDSIQVFMHTAPGILLSPDSLDICIGESFTLSINPVNILAFSWWDGLAGGQLNRTFTPQFADSTYMYWAEGINSIGCISRDTAYITVHSLPEVIIITPFSTSFCQGETVIIQTPVEDNFTYAWYINDALVGTEAEISFTAEEDVIVVLMVTNEYGCTQTEEVLITVWETPQIDLGGDRFVCPGETLDLEGPEGESFTYEWYLDGELVGVNTSVFTHIMAGTAVIRLEMNTQNGCAASDEITLTPLIAPTMVLTASETEICLGSSVLLQAATTNAVSFEWWDGLINLNRVVVPEGPGTYTYSASATSIDNCVVTDSLTIVVYPQPQASLQIFQGAPTVCQGGSITFSLAEATGLDVDHVVWNNTIIVPMGTDIIKYYTYTFEESGWFTGEVVTEEGCASIDSLFITVQPSPLMTISNDTTICAGQAIALQVTGGQTCVWTDSNGNIIGAGYTLQVAPNSTRKYFATITDATNFACSTTDSVLVTVLPAPVVTVQASVQNVCGGTPIVLTAQGADVFVWSTGQTGPTITVVPNISTTYSVIGLNEQGCTTLASIQVIIKPSPVVTLSGLLPLYCLNDIPSLLTGLPVGGIFIGPGVVGGQFRPQIAGLGTHQVIYSYIAENGCVGSDTLVTTVVGVSGSINLGADVAICPHEEITFDAGPGFQKYYWSTGDTTRTTTIKGTAYFPGTTRAITVIGTIQECSVMGTVNLTIRNDCYISIDEIENNEQLVLMPNPSRGEFAIQHNGTEGELFVSVYDGRGVEVFSGSFEDCSDGSSVCRINLSYLPKGVYMVTVRKSDKQFVRKMVLM